MQNHHNRDSPFHTNRIRDTNSNINIDSRSSSGTTSHVDSNNNNDTNINRSSNNIFNPTSASRDTSMTDSHLPERLPQTPTTPNRYNKNSNSNIISGSNSNNSLNNLTSNTTMANGLLSSPTTPRRNKKKITYGDRYIPSRTGLDLQAAFSLNSLDSHSGINSDSVDFNDMNHNSNNNSNTNSNISNNYHSSTSSSSNNYDNELDYLKEQEANRTFDAVLKSELFGDNIPSHSKPSRYNSQTNNIINNASSRSGNFNSASSNGGNHHNSTGSTTYTSNMASSSTITSISTAGSGISNSSSITTSLSSLPQQLTPPSSSSYMHMAAGDNGDVGGGRGHTGSGSGSTSSTSVINRNEELLRTPRQSSNLFTYQSPSKSKPYSSSLNVQNELYSLSPVRVDSQRLLLSPQKKPRSISKVPYRVLDAPDLADDFYLNLVDWGSQDILGVGLGSSVYLWDASNGSVNRLCDLGSNDSVTALSWIGAGTHLAVGTNSGLVEIWDATTGKCTRTMTGHSSRTSSLAWNQHILTSGSRDRTILHRDVREPAHYLSRLENHKQEVCGLKWNVEENKLASGGNDNKLYVWDGLNREPLYKFNEHSAAIKAIAWSPHQRGVLASGGGTADRTIKIWNTLTGLKISDTDTGSQVCNLAWSKNSNELVSTHGYSRNQIVIWKFNTMQQIASLTGHTYRVLYLSMSPDGQTIVTGAGDETLRFWNVFEKSKDDNTSSSVLLDAFSQLR
ncbi:anaphase-promoting complex binding protein [[Candida] boidinii]|nr:anaphase-promoting complex binding protein [[Candida] boidinii]